MTEKIRYDKRNYRKHGKRNKELIRKSLAELGAGRSVLLDADNSLIAGNGVYEQAKKLGLPVRVIETDGTELVAVKRTDVHEDDHKRALLAIADNTTSDSSEMKTDLLLADFSVDVLEEWGVNLEGLDAGKTTRRTEAQDDDWGDDDEAAAETRCKPGDVWQMGDHRLLCGDSTDPEAVARLMSGETADMWLTDPPYNVSYSEARHDIEESRGRKSRHKDIANDSMTDDAFDTFLGKAFEACEAVLKAGGAFYVWTPQGHTLTQFAAALDGVGLHFRQQLIWVKGHFVLGRMDYQGKHEPCLYGWKDGTHYFADTRSETTVIPDAQEIDLDKLKKEELKALLKQIYEAQLPTTVINEKKPNRSDLHPTMKPVRLFGRLINNSSRPGEIVMDTFCGSGTTVIACEQLGRKARIMEIDPHYCDVILSRWEKLTGRKATKL